MASERMRISIRKFGLSVLKSVAISGFVAACLCPPGPALVSVLRKGFHLGTEVFSVCAWMFLGSQVFHGFSGLEELYTVFSVPVDL